MAAGPSQLETYMSEAKSFKKSSKPDMKRVEHVGRELESFLTLHRPGRASALISSRYELQEVIRVVKLLAEATNRHEFNVEIASEVISNPYDGVLEPLNKI